MTPDNEETLRRLAIGDRAYCLSLFSDEAHAPSHALDPRSLALLRLGAATAAGTSGPIWRQRVDDALAGGMSSDEIVEALKELAPAIGIDRVVAIAPDLALALGYDMDAALERLDT